MRSMIARGLRASTLAAVVALALVACGEDADGESKRSPEQAEVGFATDLLQHDAQVLALLDLARERALPAAATAALGQVQMHRAREVETLSGWLTDLSAPTPATVRDHANAGHGDDGPHAADDKTGAELPGMPDAAELTELGAASGAEFATLLADLLAELSDGAVEIADEYRDDLGGEAADLASGLAEQRSAEEELIERIAGG